MAGLFCRRGCLKGLEVAATLPASPPGRSAACTHKAGVGQQNSPPWLQRTRGGSNVAGVAAVRKRPALDNKTRTSIAFVLAMAWRYVKMSMLGIAAAYSDDDEIMAALAILTQTPQKRPWGGSVPGHKTYRRNRLAADWQLKQDYFIERPIYNEEHFRRRFRMRRELFLRIVDEVAAKNSFFQQRRNAAGQLGFSALHKCTVAVKMLAYGGPADELDDHLKMGESTVLETLNQFVTTVIEVYEKEFLRPPRSEEIEHILSVNSARGFPGMIGSIDCMHWEWSSCPAGWQGMYRGHKGKPTLILEAVATEDRRIWHANFGLPGSHNDINVLHRSNVFDDLANGRAPSVEFHVNGNIYSLGYYLADGIYPDWATLVKSIRMPISNKQKVYSERQEACRKDVERTFGVFQAKFKIIHRPARLWNPKVLNSIMRACVILHNMIVEDERGLQLPTVHPSEWPGVADPPINQDREIPGVEQLIDAQDIIEDKETAALLQNDLMEHLWTLYGQCSGPFAPKHRT